MLMRRVTVFNRLVARLLPSGRKSEAASLKSQQAPHQLRCSLVNNARLEAFFRCPAQSSQHRERPGPGCSRHPDTQRQHHPTSGSNARPCVVHAPSQPRSANSETAARQKARSLWRNSLTTSARHRVFSPSEHFRSKNDSSSQRSACRTKCSSRFATSNDNTVTKS